MSQILLFTGLLLFAFACRTYNNRYLAKAGWVAVLVATYVGAYGLTGRHSWGWVAVAMWFLFPWVEIMGRVRKLRFPIHSEVKHRFPPSREVFPDLDEISSEMEEAGFEQTDDAGWKWEDTDHFIRLFYNGEKKLQSSINIAQQGEFVFSHASVTTRTADGLTLVTTNYPFSFTMKPTPKQRMNRCDDAETFEEMLESHEAFLTKAGATSETIEAQDPEHLSVGVEEELSKQIDHNLTAGVIVKADDKHFRYSWRGCLFLWFQVLKDMIRV